MAARREAEAAEAARAAAAAEEAKRLAAKAARRTAIETVFKRFARANPSPAPGRPALLGLGVFGWARLCKGVGLLTGKYAVSMNAADMVFVQVRSKSAASINFRQFMQALELIAVMATEESEDDASDEAFEAILQKVISAAATPLVDTNVAQPGTTEYVESPIFAKLNDAGKYTGAHRHRFDRATGLGKGKVGRTELTDYTRSLHQLTRTCGVLATSCSTDVEILSISI